MAELDTSNHILNNSTSKQKFSFPKTQRFGQGSKTLYFQFNSDVIVTTKYPPPGQAGPPPLATDTKTSDSESTNLFRPLAPTN